MTAPERFPAPFRVVSGGQTGVDRAALDAARAAGLEIGGWCPAGRAAEDGPIPAGYPLRETAERDPAHRTRRNVRESDGTLVVIAGRRDAGTRLTEATARALGRPLHVLDLAGTPDLGAARGWIAEHRIRVLNVAGPRESESPGIGDRTRRALAVLFSSLTRPPA